jgi:hypothetical protein
MHDPNQDRLMVQRMTYFRVKHLRLPEAYAQFLEETLEPGGTLFLVECGLRWPTTRVGERHLFQFGALGGATPAEYLHGGPRVEAYLRRYDSPRRRWDPPEPDGEHPEAEWGFEPALRADVEALARRRGWRLRRIVFDQPEDLSPLVADLHRWWYRRLGRPDGRLLVESFVLLDPYWALRTGAVPFWMVFNVEPSAAGLLQRGSCRMNSVTCWSHSRASSSSVVGRSPVAVTATWPPPPSNPIARGLRVRTVSPNSPAKNRSASASASSGSSFVVVS